jgi:hypothetical protein
LLALVFRADLGNIIKLRADAPDTEIEVRWIRQLVRNLELLIAWLVLWIILHFGSILVAGIVLGPGHGAPNALLILLEVVPGLFVALSVARLALTAWQLPRMIKAVGEARGASRPPPAWTQRQGILLPLVTASDLDFLIALGLIVIFETLANRTG